MYSPLGFLLLVVLSTLAVTSYATHFIGRTVRKYAYCKDSYHKVMSYCLKAPTEVKSWEDARLVCKKDGTDLVTFSSIGVHNLMAGYLKYQQACDEEEAYPAYFTGLKVSANLTWLNKRKEGNSTLQAIKREADPSKKCLAFVYSDGEYHLRPRSCNDAQTRSLCALEHDFKKSQYLYEKKWTYSCDCQWDGVIDEPKCLKAFDTEKIWHLADVQCNMFGGRLVEIKNKGTNLYIQEMTARQPNSQYWIGLNEESDGKFLWATELNVNTFNAWDIGQPNTNTTDRRRCVVFVSGGGRWQTEKCYTKKKFICEMDAKFISETKTLLSITGQEP